ncbi:peptidoglycan-binding domain-containing protein [Kitasatospora sp. NPDC097691]|uniref:peptidoglycan-binding domain-containing protein n=1 Tax=Kitasatospora sp. NPDC097691 TaxID=3157231 RepID=UPI00332DFE66
MSIRKRARSVSTVAAISAAVLAVSAGTASAKPGVPYVRYGASGLTAYCVQTAINHASVNRRTSADIILPDGKFGPATLGALQQLQRDFNLDPDGVVGPDTGTVLWQQIDEEIRQNYNWDTGFGAYASYCYYVLPTHS